ncbi:MAG: RNA-guided endonuclease InsQ/TnpB family protein, partial [Candidatus Lutacidiplasmatales archaeon]
MVAARRTFEYRLYPFADQLPCLYHHLSELSFLWNYALGRRVDAWRKEHRTETYLDQQNLLKAWRAFDSGGLGKLSFAVEMDALQRLDLAYRALFRRHGAGERPGFPRFRSARHPTTSFTFYPRRNPVDPGRGRTERLAVPRIGAIPIRIHRPLPADAVVKSVTVRQEGDQWYVILSAELPDPPPPP